MQYQADDSASGAPTSAPGSARRPTGAGRSPDADGDADAGDDEHHECEHRASGARGSGGPASQRHRLVDEHRLGDAGRGRCGRRARRGRPITARPGRPRPPPRARTPSGTRGNCESERWPRPWRSPRTGPPSRRPGCRVTAVAVQVSAKAAGRGVARVEGARRHRARSPAAPSDERARARAASPPRPPRSDRTDAAHAAARAARVRGHRHRPRRSRTPARRARRARPAGRPAGGGPRSSPAGGGALTDGGPVPDQGRGQARRPPRRSAPRRAPAGGRGARCRRDTARRTALADQAGRARAGRSEHLGRVGQVLRGERVGQTRLDRPPTGRQGPGVPQPQHPGHAGRSGWAEEGQRLLHALGRAGPSARRPRRPPPGAGRAPTNTRAATLTSWRHPNSRPAQVVLEGGDPEADAQRPRPARPVPAPPSRRA